MAFKFSLATVLRVREIAEKREERMLQQIQQEISNTLQSIVSADSEMKTSNMSRQTHVNNVSRAIAIRSSYDELILLQLNREELEQRLKKLEVLKARQLNIYCAARLDREVLSKMLGNTRTLYEADISKREQTTLDDNYIARRRRTDCES